MKKMEDEMLTAIILAGALLAYLVIGRWIMAAWAYIANDFFGPNDHQILTAVWPVVAVAFVLRGFWFAATFLADPPARAIARLKIFRKGN